MTVKGTHYLAGQHYMILQQSIYIFPSIHIILYINVNITRMSVLRWKIISLLHKPNKIYTHPVTSLYLNSSALDESKPILSILISWQDLFLKRSRMRTAIAGFILPLASIQLPVLLMCKTHLKGRKVCTHWFGYFQELSEIVFFFFFQFSLSHCKNEREGARDQAIRAL